MTMLKRTYVSDERLRALLKERFPDRAEVSATDIVTKAKKDFENAIGAGHDETGRKALENGLEKLSTTPGLEDSPEWLSGQIEILCDLKRYDDCPPVLEKLERSLRSGDRGYLCPGDPDSDADSTFYEELSVSKLFSVACETRNWPSALRYARILGLDVRNMEPLESREEGIAKCKELFNLGLTYENLALKPNDELKLQYLKQAMQEYKYGCNVIEICHHLFDDRQCPVTGFDHRVCANLFTSAARLCLEFHKLPSPPSVQETFKDGRMAIDWTDQALEFLEHGRSRSLQESIQQNPVNVPDRSKEVFDQVIIRINQLIREAQRKRRLSSPVYNDESGTPSPTAAEPLNDRTKRRWHTAIDKAVEQHRAALNQYPIIESAVTIFPTAEELRKRIPEDTVVVEFAQASEPPEGLMVLVITSERVENATWSPCDVKRINELIENAALAMWQKYGRAGVKNVSKEDGEEALRELSDILLQPTMSELRTRKRIVFVTSGNLAHLPWAMLPLSKPLIESHTITVTPSLWIWSLLRDKPYSGRTEPLVSVVCNSPYDEDGFLRHDNIPYARVEALHLARLHKKWPVLADKELRSDFEKAIQSVDILHLCAHGKFDADSPWLSNIHLFEPNLTAADLTRLDVNSKLVVFSSCFSGLSKGHDSGSAFGFSHALLGSGAQCFIGTLWPVEDAATLIFMILFYEQLRSGATPAESLRAGQLAMRNMNAAVLSTLIDNLSHLAEIDIETAKKYIYHPENRLNRELPSLQDRIDEFRKPHAWAGFVLTGYGDEPIYRVQQDEATCGAHRDEFVNRPQRSKRKRMAEDYDS